MRPTTLLSYPLVPRKKVAKVKGCTLRWVSLSEGDANELGTPHNDVIFMEYATLFNTYRVSYKRRISSQGVRNIQQIRHSPMLLIHFNCEIGKGRRA